MLIKFSCYGFLKNLKFFDPFFLLFFLSKGLTYTQIGVLISVREIFLNIFEIPSGIFADLFSKKKAMLVCFASFIVSFFIIHFASNFLFLIVSMIFFGLGEAFRTGTHKAIILDYLELNNIMHKKLEYYGTTRAWSQLGAALSALIAGGIVFYFQNFDYIFIASVIPYIAGFCLILSYPEFNNICQKKCFSMHIKDFYKEIFSKKIGKIVINSASFEAVFKACKDYIQPVISISIPTFFIFDSLNEYKKTALILSLFYFVIYILSSISSKNSFKLLNTFKLSEYKALNFSFYLTTLLIITAGLFIIFDFSLNIYFTILVFALLYIVYNFRKPIIVSFYGQYMDKSHRAGILSVDSQVKSVFLMFFAPVIGLMADNFGIGSGLFYFGIIIFSLSYFLKFNKD